MQEPLITISLSEYERLKGIEEKANEFQEAIEQYDTLVVDKEHVLGKSLENGWKELDISFDEKGISMEQLIYLKDKPFITKDDLIPKKSLGSKFYAGQIKVPVLKTPFTGDEILKARVNGSFFKHSAQEDKE